MNTHVSGEKTCGTQSSWRGEPHNAYGWLVVEQNTGCTGEKSSAEAQLFATYVCAPPVDHQGTGRGEPIHCGTWYCCRLAAGMVCRYTCLGLSAGTR